jgi:UDP:flavonoid glycosyltransferase YjiC (YdhE family)
VRVLFTTTPGRGHLHPMVPLARAFIARGHDVAWAAAEDVCSRLRREGFHAVPAGPPEEFSMAEFGRRFPEVLSLPPAQRPDVVFPGLFGDVQAPPMLDDLLPVAREWKPSLLVCEQAELAGPIVAAALGVPNATHAFGSVLPRKRIEAASERVAALWEAHGLEPRPFAGTYDHLYLDIYPRSLQAGEMAHIADVQPLRHVTFAAGGDEGRPDWLDTTSGDPLVYVTFGTVFNRDTSVIATVVEALRELPLRVVVTLGPGRDPGLLGPQPANVHVAAYIAQTQLLPHCAAVASHAGSGTFLAALARGLPQLFVPQAADQFLNAAAGSRAGVGIAVAPRDLTVENVREAFGRVLGDPAIRAGAERLGEEIQAMPGPETVVAAIERRFGPAGG